MRILLITHFYPPGHLGGTEVLTSDLAGALTADGHTVQVVCAEDWENAEDYRINGVDDVHAGVPVHRLYFNWMKAPEVFRYLYRNPEVKQYMLEYMQLFRPDVVHITSCYSLSASVIEAARELAIPILLTATDFWFMCARNTLLQPDDTLCSGPEPWKCARCLLADAKAYQWPRTLLGERITSELLMAAGRSSTFTNLRGIRGLHGDWEDRIDYLGEMLHETDLIVTASAFVRDRLIAQGADPASVRFSQYGVDTTWATDALGKSDSSRLRIGFIGQILPFKGPDLLIRAVQNFDPEAPIDVLIYGDLEKDPDYGYLLQELAHDDPRIRFMGTFPSSQIGTVLQGMDVLAVPSTWYDFPLVISSALATQTPILATDLPGMNELVEDDVNGILFDRFSVEGIEHAIRRLLNEPSLLKHLRNGIQPIKTVDEMKSEYVAIYDELMVGSST